MTWSENSQHWLFSTVLLVKLTLKFSITCNSKIDEQGWIQVMIKMAQSQSRAVGHYSKSLFFYFHFQMHLELWGKAKEHWTWISSNTSLYQLSTIVHNSPFCDPQPHPSIFLQKSSDFFISRSLQEHVCVVCKLFLANSFVWQNNQPDCIFIIILI